MFTADGYLQLVREQHELLEEKEQRELEPDEPVSSQWEPDEDSFGDK